MSLRERYYAVPFKFRCLAAAGLVLLASPGLSQLWMLGPGTIQFLMSAAFFLLIIPLAFAPGAYRYAYLIGFLLYPETVLAAAWIVWTMAFAFGGERMSGLLQAVVYTAVSLTILGVWTVLIPAIQGARARVARWGFQSDHPDIAERCFHYLLRFAERVSPELMADEIRKMVPAQGAPYVLALIEAADDHAPRAFVSRVILRLSLDFIPPFEAFQAVARELHRMVDETADREPLGPGALRRLVLFSLYPHYAEMARRGVDLSNLKGTDLMYETLLLLEKQNLVGSAAYVEFVKDVHDPGAERTAVADRWLDFIMGHE
jgi:hypothetical protein